MRFEVRLHINGANFNPQAFADGLLQDEAGDVHQYLGRRAAEARFGSGYWVSKAVKVDESPEAACLSLLTSMSSQLNAARASGGEMTIQVSAYCKPGDGHRGFYVPSRLAYLMGAIDASLDYSPEIDLQVPSQDH